MNVLYFDIDSLRPDHLSGSGYPRATSANIDRLAAESVRFTNCYASDVPCLPSRTALFSGRFGIHNGVVNHGGAASEPFAEGPARGFRSTLAQTCWMTCLRQIGLRTITISSFADRHSALHFLAGFHEIHNPGKHGLECADEVSPIAIDWLARNGRERPWFLHVNLWDPHTPYRTPDRFGNPFKDDPLPAWYNEDIRLEHWMSCGPHSAREVMGYGTTDAEWQYATKWPKQPVVMDSMDKVRMMFDGYDCGVRFADDHIGRILNQLTDLNLLDETIVIVSADHGENLGELNIYGDHQTADEFTCHIPMIVRIPGMTDGSRLEKGLIYNLDIAATLIDLLGGQVPDNWDVRGFADQLRHNQSIGRGHLVLSQGAWTCQRAIRFENWICIKSLHDGHHGFAGVMLFDLSSDPHEQHDVANEHPQIVRAALTKLDDWHANMMSTSSNRIDPMQAVLDEGGPFHARGNLAAYLERLRVTERSRWCDRLRHHE